MEPCIRLFTEMFSLATFLMGYFSDSLAHKGPTSIEDSARKGTAKYIIPGRVGKDERQDSGSQQFDPGRQPWTSSLTCKMGFSQQYLPAQRHGEMGEKGKKKNKHQNKTQEALYKPWADYLDLWINQGLYWGINSGAEY